jgi:hypothetical protein
LLGYRCLNPYGLAYGFFGTEGTIFDKTAFFKFKISDNFKQNIDETGLKQPKIHMKIHTSL